MNQPVLCLLLPLLSLASCGAGADSSVSSSISSAPQAIDPYIVAPDAFSAEDYPAIEHAGTIVDFSYRYGKNSKTAKVYLPYGYEEGSNYETMYLVHSFNGSETTYIDKIAIGNILDNLMEQNEIQPMIVVMPTWNLASSVPTESEIVANFPDEIAALVPLIENAYKTYQGLGARDHRICAGYSMGGIVTWSVLARHTELFRTYINMSGYLWEVTRNKSEADEAKNMAYLEEHLAAASESSFNLYNYAGGQDFVEPYLLALLSKLTESDYFDFTKNATIEIEPNASHDTVWSGEYLVDALKTIY